MKRFLLVFALLPLVSFASGLSLSDIESVLRCYSFFYSDSSSLSSVQFNSVTLDNVPTIFFNSKLGIEISANVISHPRFVSSLPTNGQSSASIDYPIMAKTVFSNSSLLYYSPYVFPEILNIYSTVFSLHKAGFISPSLQMVYNQGSVSRYNFIFSDIVSDVLSSTNTLYRQILFSYLGQINNSLYSIGSSVGTINTDYQTVNNLILNPSKQNLLDSAANSLTVNGGPDVASNLDELYGSSYAGRESEITKALSDLARSQLQAAWLSTLDLDSPFYMQDINDILSDPDTFQKAALQGGGGGGSALANIMRDVKKLSTNDWASAVTNQLANNRASITNQLAHMFDDDTSVGSKLGNIESSSSQSASAAGSIDERLARGITVAVVNSGANSVLVSLDGPVNIDQTQFNSLSVPLGSLQNTVSDWYSDWYSFFSVSSPVYKWENFYNMVSAFKDQNHIDLSAVTNSLSSISSLSNLLASIDEHLTNSLPNLTNFAIASSSFSALLLDHYEDYITNSVYSDAIEKLEVDYPSVYSNLVAFGLSPSGDGDFWSLFGSSLVQLDLLADNFISDIAKVRKFADDNIQGGFSAGISSIVEVMPKKEDIVSAASSASNVVSALDLSSTNLVSAFHSVTSRADSVFSPFHGSFETVPSDLVLFKTGNDKYITIPVHEHPEAFRLMRWGFSFALAAVNFIFFPKFVLMLVMLFSKLSQRFVKFYPSVRNE